MPYIAVMNWDGSNRITKYRDFATLAEAQAVAIQGGTLPGTQAGAFAVLHPGGPIEELTVNSVAQTVASSPDLTKKKKEKILALDKTLAAKIALGWTYGGKVYQVTERHVRNMERFVNALNYYVDEIALWFTATAYVVGDLVRVGKIFYRCAENHTSGVWLTDLAAVKWAVWYFHPYKGGDGKWRALDNSMNALTLAQTKAMCEGAINYEAQCQAQAVVHKDGANACANVTALNAYDITANWPTNS